MTNSAEKEVIKPPRLKRGDKVGVLCPSWGGPSLFPQVYERGLRNIEELLELQIVELETARMPAATLAREPATRARAIEEAFLNDELTAIISAIGGSDSVRLLPYLDREIARRHPKILLGFSDTTTLLTHFAQAGLVTFQGPSIMAGFSQMHLFPPEVVEWIRTILFGDEFQTLELPLFSHYSEGYTGFDLPVNPGLPREVQGDQLVLKFIQGQGRVQGRLFGGCMEVLEMMKGTTFWPSSDFFQGKILIFETSEESPSPSFVEFWLRNYGMQGVFEKIAGILVGWPYNYTPQQKEELEGILKRVVTEEFERPDLPIVSNLSFGHTDPQLLLPLNGMCEIDCTGKRVRLLERVVL